MSTTMCKYNERSRDTVTTEDVRTTAGENKNKKRRSLWAWIGQKPDCKPLGQVAAAPHADHESHMVCSSDSDCHREFDASSLEYKDPGSGGCTLTRTVSFRRAYYRAYVAKHIQDPSHLGTLIEGSCPFVQAAPKCLTV